MPRGRQNHELKLQVFARVLAGISKSVGAHPSRSILVSHKCVSLNVLLLKLWLRHLYHLHKGRNGEIKSLILDQTVRPFVMFPHAKAQYQTMTSSSILQQTSQIFIKQTWCKARELLRVKLLVTRLSHTRWRHVSVVGRVSPHHLVVDFWSQQ